MRASGSYDGEPGTISAARRLAADFLGRVRAASQDVPPIPGRAVENIQLVVSELVTNAVKHAGGPYGVDLNVVGDTVEITVWDTSPATVTAMPHDPARIGQHGMEIVTALCGGFEVRHTPTGKQVRVRMALYGTAR